MKSRIFLLLISLIVIQPALPCYDPSYRNQDLWMFRAVEGNDEGKFVCKETVDENVKLWLKAVGGNAKAEDVIQIVYKTSLDSLRRLAIKDANPFARCLLKKQNKDYYEFLLIAKEVEELRTIYMGDLWYYPTDDDAEHTRLNELLDKCKAGMSGTLAPRYAVQAMRIMIEISDCRAIISFWEKYQHKLPKNVLRRMAADYVGGAYEKLGDKENARRMYIEAENVFAVRWLMDAEHSDSTQSEVSEKVAQIKTALAVLPNTRSLRLDVQEVVREYEKSIKHKGNYDEYNSPFDFAPFKRGDSVQNLEAYRRLRDITVAATKNREIKDKAFWHYTAAYLYYLDGRDNDAARHLAMAEKNPASQFDRESIHAFRILFDTDTRNPSRQEWLANLRWLEKRVKTDTVNIKDNYSYVYIPLGHSISYWYDVMRKVCERGADRLAKRGNTTLAMQISNYGNYCLLPLVQEYDYWSGKLRKISYAQLRESWRIHNRFDYCNPFFERMDSLSASQAAAFAIRVAHPQDGLDKFLLAGGYFDKDYIGEHVGTMYLREMNYAKACKWLENVSCDYQNNTNIKDYFYLDPFQWLDVDHKVGDKTDYKLNFARRMLQLEREMTKGKDPNRKANAKLNYAIGLRNSFGRCWALTLYSYSYWPEDDSQYEAGYPNFSSFRSGFQNIKQAQKAYAKFDRLVAEALKEFTSAEMLAQAHLRMKNFKTVMEQYANTAAARSIKGLCDKYRDYALQKK